MWVTVDRKEISDGPHEDHLEVSELKPTQKEIAFNISIQDFGVGIPKSKLNSLFMNFGTLEEH